MGLVVSEFFDWKRKVGYYLKLISINSDFIIKYGLEYSFLIFNYFLMFKKTKREINKMLLVVSRIC